ncbi:mRNA decay protein, partial [Exophiala xenobiotica]
KLVANAQILCDVLGQEMPDLAEKDGTETAASGTVGMIKTGDYLKGSAEGAGIWEDEEERRFYENLVDLKGRVPAILLEDSKKKSETDDRTDTTMSESSKPSEADDQSTAIANKSVGAQVDAILLRLPELQTKDMVDQVALDFCFLNSKASRNRLIKSLQEVPKGRTDLLPLYARLAATLGQYMPDIVQSLISHLDDEFRSLQRRKTKDFLGQVRLLNVRYLAELTKFGIVPEHVIFHCLKVSLDDFSRMNIEMAAHLLENCGRYLLRNPETSPRMASFLETLNRKKSAQHLGSQERMLIENALYYVDPPQRA